MAAAVADRIKQARLAILAHILPLNNSVRVAEELAMLDYLTGGRLVVGLLRGTVNEDQTFDECGVGTVDFLFQGPAMEHKAVMKSLELFAKEVLPRLQELTSCC
jgi:hypothetical protein